MESKGPDERRPRIVTLKVISWNLLRLTGAGVEDVAALIQQHRPDLLLFRQQNKRGDTRHRMRRLSNESP